MQGDPPVRIVNSEVVFQNPRFTVMRDTQQFPDNSEHRWESVVYRPSVHALPIDADGSVLLIRQYRPQLARETLEVVGGGVEGDHTPAEAVHRELLEEAGLTARLIPLGDSQLGVSTVRCRVYHFLAAVESVGERDLEPFEQVTMRPPERTSLARAVDLVMDGTIIDVNSRLTIMLAAEHIRRHGLPFPG